MFALILNCSDEVLEVVDRVCAILDPLEDLFDGLATACVTVQLVQVGVPLVVVLEDLGLDDFLLLVSHDFNIILDICVYTLFI